MSIESQSSTMQRLADKVSQTRSSLLTLTVDVPITASDSAANARSRFGMLLVCCDIDQVEIYASQEPSKGPRYPSRSKEDLVSTKSCYQPSVDGLCHAVSMSQRLRK